MHITPRFPEGREKAFTTSFDDGDRRDIDLINLMKQYGIRGTFNLNSMYFYHPDATNRVRAEELREVYLDNGMEVACHAFHHLFLGRIPVANAVADVMADRMALEQICGMPITGMAYPYGNVSDELVDGLKACGICYSRLTPSTFGFGLPRDWYRWTGTTHHGKHEVEECTEKFLSAELRSRDDPLLYYVWGHSYEFDRDDGLWEKEERLYEAVADDQKIWHATNMEIYRYLEAYRHLEFGAEFTCVRNGSAIPVWFLFGDNMIRVGAGETVNLSGYFNPGEDTFGGLAADKFVPHAE